MPEAGHVTCLPLPVNVTWNHQPINYCGGNEWECVVLKRQCCPYRSVGGKHEISKKKIHRYFLLKMKCLPSRLQKKEKKEIRFKKKPFPYEQNTWMLQHIFHFSVPVPGNGPNWRNWCYLNAPKKKTFLTKLKQKKCQKRSIKAVFTRCGKYCVVQTLSVDVDVWIPSA